MLHTRFHKIALMVAGCMLASAGGAWIVQQHRDGYTDTPILPGQKWHVHDPARPYPHEVTPGKTNSDPPSDAIVLFDGANLDHWYQTDNGGADGVQHPAKWQLVENCIQVVGGTGYLYSKDKFGDCQLHIEWHEDKNVQGASQGRGNSGVFLMGKYEIQVLDSYHATTYADGQAGAIYGQWPPLVNPQRPPGEWQTYDVVFRAPKWNGNQLVTPAYETVFFNGVLIHDHQKLNGSTGHRGVFPYENQGEEAGLALQDHGPGQPLRFRNIWVRRLKDYDQPEQ